VTGLVYDTGALIAGERNDRALWALHRRALERGTVPVVPMPVLVEGWRGQAALARLLKGCRPDELTEPRAKAAGRLLGSCPAKVEATDAVVVEAALRLGSAVVTSNRSHLTALAEGAKRGLSLIHC
jgi:hypothetical protein